jgi:hypothetical protein
MLMLMQMQCNYGAKHLRCYNRDAKSEPKVRPGSRAVPRYCCPSLSRDVYRNLVIGDL